MFLTVELNWELNFFEIKFENTIMFVFEIKISKFSKLKPNYTRIYFYIEIYVIFISM